MAQRIALRNVTVRLQLRRHRLWASMKLFPVLLHWDLKISQDAKQIFGSTGSSGFKQRTDWLPVFKIEIPHLKEIRAKVLKCEVAERMQMVVEREEVVLFNQEENCLSELMINGKP
ncbi:unnamed protein product [Hymenolepis diminuta]|uniref:SHSP domain-containing protein n=1 Tax=Hymenolepis diminuta TaxID=6216 RepID=A0A0R3ST75_HYMDI|nr:unnamed protein product [Hymenolepis diminuta]